MLVLSLIFSISIIRNTVTDQAKDIAPDIDEDLMDLFDLDIPDNYTNPETRLVKDLFKNYDRNARPMVHPDEPIHVGNMFVLGRVEELDEKSQKMTSFGWLPLRWTDPSLRWHPALYSNVTRISVVADQIWMPEISLLNGASETGDLGLKENSYRVNIDYNGVIAFEPNIRWITSCKVNLVQFPFDEQHCYINITSFTFDITRVMFHPLSDEVFTVYFEENGEWELVNTSVGYFTIKSDENIYLGCVYAELVLKRRPIFYILNILLPSITISIFSIFLFILPIETGERVSLGISVVISYSVITLMIGDTMPSSGIKLPALFIFVTECMVLTAVCVMAAVINMNIFHMDKSKKITGIWKLLIVEIIGRLVLVTKWCPSKHRERERAEHKQITDVEDLNVHNYSSRTTPLSNMAAPAWYQRTPRSISVQPFLTADLGGSGGGSSGRGGVGRLSSRDEWNLPGRHYSAVDSHSDSRRGGAGVRQTSANAKGRDYDDIDTPIAWSDTSLILDRLFALMALGSLVVMSTWLAFKLS